MSNYSKEEMKEIKDLRNKYVSEKDKQKTNLEKMKELDAKTTKPGKVVALTLGIISSLILGIGMSCVMVFNVSILGILVGIIGLVGMIAVFPIYKHLVEVEKQKVRDEILKLADEV